MSVRYDPARPWSEPAAGREQVGLQRIRTYTLTRWGGTDAGIYSPRAVRGGSSPSVHRDGRAHDWQATTRERLLQAIAFYLKHADSLQIQRIVDYGGRRVWTTGRGWAAFSGSGAGELTRNYHLERNWIGALDARSVEEVLRASAPGVPSELEEDVDMVLTGQRPTVAGRYAYAVVKDRAVLLWNGARVEGDVKFGPGLYVWTPQQPHPLTGVDLDRARGVLVASATDGGTFAAKLRAA